jgi:hypothetical protein
VTSDVSGFKRLQQWLAANLVLYQISVRVPQVEQLLSKNKIDFRVIRNFNDGKRAALFADS